MKYIVYKTTNKINKKIYIGVHLTNDPDVFDGYLGCGISRMNTCNYYKRPGFPAAVAKYGYENFEREVLYVFNGDEKGEKLAYGKEAELVTEAFVKRPDTYNLIVGGRHPYTNPLKSDIPINQYSMEGTFIKTWNSIAEAQGEWGVRNIKKAVTGSYHHCGGFQWKYYEGNTDNIEPAIVKEKIVYQFDLSGNLIKAWNSIADAATYYNIAGTAISNCCYKKVHQSVGYYWSFENRFEMTKSKNFTAVAKYNDKGEFLASYEAINEAAADNNIGSTANIIAAIRGTTQKRCGGFRWRYFEGDTSDIEPLK